MTNSQVKLELTQIWNDITTPLRHYLATDKCFMNILEYMENKIQTITISNSFIVMGILGLDLQVDLDQDHNHFTISLHGHTVCTIASSYSIKAIQNYGQKHNLYHDIRVRVLDLYNEVIRACKPRYPTHNFRLVNNYGSPHPQDFRDYLACTWVALRIEIQPILAPVLPGAEL